MTTPKKKTAQSACKVCKTPYRVREAGHKLAKGGGGDAASVLSKDGKAAKKRRKKRGCLDGTPGVKGLTERQKKNLPKAMQEGLLAYRKRMAKGKGR
jgi:hypothetical protein